MLPKDYADQNCSIARVLELVGERWTLLIVRDAFHGVRRFADFHAHLGIPRAVLASRLKDLVGNGVLERRRYTEQPPRDEYVLTDLGTSLWPVVYTMAAWGDRHLPGPGGPRWLFRHAGCDAPLDDRGRCTACGDDAPAAEVEAAPGPGAGPGGDRISRALRAPHRLLTPL